MKKIMTVIGARPQFIKAAIVSRALQQEKNIKEIFVHTGQHYDANMSEIFFNELEMPNVDYQLNITAPTHGKQTGDMLIAIEKVLLKEQPDWVLVYGDTNSTLAAALASAKCHIPIAHVEAGLRSYNRKMPEEVNRLVADQVADILFVPTEQAIRNLEQEGYSAQRIVPVGDVMYDAALFYANKAATVSQILTDLNLHQSQYMLATIHRAENTNNHHKLLTIFTALNRLAQKLPVVMPLHPRTRNVLQMYFPDVLKNSAIHVLNPVGFLDMIMLEKHAALIFTDSGGIQKEAFFYQIPCVTLRDETEWVETIDLGWNRLANQDNIDTICEITLASIGTKGIETQFPYGDGEASKKIASYISRRS